MMVDIMMMMNITKMMTMNIMMTIRKDVTTTENMMVAYLILIVILEDSVAVAGYAMATVCLSTLTVLQDTQTIVDAPRDVAWSASMDSAAHHPLCANQKGPFRLVQ
jgi:hypothetical protein